MKRIVAITVVVVLVFVFITGYLLRPQGNKIIETTTTEDIKVVLNERQKNILKQEGLPTDYEKLDFTQKTSIEAIEDLLQHLEKKYGDKFSYVEYTPSGIMNKESLIAKDEDIKDMKNVKISCYCEDDKVVYEDNYKEKKAELEYKKELFKFLNKQIPGKEAKCVIYTDILEYDPKIIDLIEASGAETTIGINGISVEQYDNLIKEYDEWMSKRKLKYSTLTIFALFDNKRFKEIDKETVIDKYIHDNKYIKCIEWYDDLDEKTIEECN